MAPFRCRTGKPVHQGQRFLKIPEETLLAELVTMKGPFCAVELDFRIESGEPRIASMPPEDFVMARVGNGASIKSNLDELSEGDPLYVALPNYAPEHAVSRNRVYCRPLGESSIPSSHAMRITLGGVRPDDEK